jgi:UDP-3-O-[3-hydroxymyristoyl] N-acetylglucosamine deacetylase
LYACGIDNARIILDGPEVPILDGSALPFVSRIQKTMTVRQSELRRAILIKSSIVTSDMDKYASFHPCPIPWICLENYFDSTVFGRQLLSLPVDLKTFRDELAPARMFGFEEQVNELRELGLARGGSLRNQILINNRAINEDGLRYVDEFVRHKALDCIGDMALAGARIVGQFSGCRTDHKLNIALIHELMLRDDCWEYTTLLDAHAYWKRTDVVTRVDIHKSSRAGVEFEFVTKSHKVTNAPVCEVCEAPITEYDPVVIRN